MNGWLKAGLGVSAFAIVFPAIDERIFGTTGPGLAVGAAYAMNYLVCYFLLLPLGFLLLLVGVVKSRYEPDDTDRQEGQSAGKPSDKSAGPVSAVETWRYPLDKDGHPKH